MFRKRGLVLVMLSLAMGGGAAWVANNWVQTRSEATASDTGQAVVLAAALNIPYGTKVEARHIREMPLPKGSVPSGAILDRANVEGYVATAEILNGEILFQSRFVFLGCGIAAGYRNIGLAIKKSRKL